MPFEKQAQTPEHRDADPSTTAKDRKLGDEWADWNGASEEVEGVIRESTGKFLALSLFVVLLLCGGWLLFWFLVEPRLAQWSPPLRWIALTALAGILAAPMVLYALLIVEVRFQARVLPYRITERFLFFLLPKAVWLGKRFGQSRDRVAHSFIRVNNRVTRNHNNTGSKRSLLVLLPRCLQSSVRNEIRQLAERYPFQMSTVAGGEEARKVIRRNRPDFIIAMACERDLVTGIRDVAMFVPVIGIPNERPEGPCKNTVIRMEELETALDMLFGKNSER